MYCDLVLASNLKHPDIVRQDGVTYGNTVTLYVDINVHNDRGYPGDEGGQRECLQLVSWLKACATYLIVEKGLKKHISMATLSDREQLMDTLVL